MRLFCKGAVLLSFELLIILCFPTPFEWSSWRQVGCFLSSMSQTLLFLQDLERYPDFRQPKHDILLWTNLCRSATAFFINLRCSWSPWLCVSEKTPWNSLWQSCFHQHWLETPLLRGVDSLASLFFYYHLVSKHKAMSQDCTRSWLPSWIFWFSLQFNLRNGSLTALKEIHKLAQFQTILLEPIFGHAWSLSLKDLAMWNGFPYLPSNIFQAAQWVDSVPRRK